MEGAYIYDTVRSPRGRGKNGSLNELTAVALSAKILQELRERNNLNTQEIEDVIWGNVTQVGEQGGCLARSAVIAANYSETTPGLSINRFCASGLEAVNLATNQVKGSAGDAYVAGGVEMMSRVPMGSDGAAIAVDPTLAMNSYFVPQGISADILAPLDFACSYSSSTKTPPPPEITKPSRVLSYGLEAFSGVSLYFDDNAVIASNIAVIAK